MLYIESKYEVENIIPFLNSMMIYQNELREINEIFSMVTYLYSNYKLDLLHYPFGIIKRESPDFSMLCEEINFSKGIEHTSSTLQDFKMAKSELNKMPPKSKLELSYYSPFKKLSKKNINKGLRTPNEKLIGSGYSGDRPEIEWAEIIKEAILHKTGILNKKHFEIFATNELIIEDDSPVKILIDLDLALNYLDEHITKYRSITDKIIFDKIHVISRNTFVYDIISKSERIDISKDKLNKS